MLGFVSAVFLLHLVAGQIFFSQPDLWQNSRISPDEAELKDSYNKTVPEPITSADTEKTFAFYLVQPVSFVIFGYLWVDQQSSTTITTTPATSTVKVTTTTQLPTDTTASTTTSTPATTTVTLSKPFCENMRISNKERVLFLDMHNKYRSHLAEGRTQVNAGWGIAPPATIIYRMKYDCTAESYAQQAVSACRQTPLPQYAIGNHKQNIRVVRSSTTREGAIKNAVSTWWTELSRHGFRSNMLFLPSEHNRSNPATSWSKMAWWNNLRLGCAIQHCGPVYVISCMYSPGGNYDYSYIYRIGAVCSECASGCDSDFLCRW